MNRLPQLIAGFALILLGFAFPVTHAMAAATILFNPTNVSANQNDTFTVNINVNTNGDAVTGSDATILYAANDLDFVTASNGNFFPNFTQANDAAAGQLVLRGYVTNITDAKTGTGTMGTVVFKVKKTSGSSTMSFVCSGTGHDTNIIASNGQNILSCTNINQLGVTYTSPATPTSTPTPTPGGNITPTPTPMGNFTPVCASLSSDINQGIGAPVTVTFTCSGTDQFGDITAAYFDFGDYTNDTIYKNVGSPGSISTTHTYTTIGSLGASCKVRDNDMAWSSVSTNCKEIITIKPKPSASATTQAAAVLPTPTPTPEIVAFVYETPTPTMQPEAPMPTEIPVQTAASRFNWWFIPVILIAAGGLILWFARSKKPKPEAGTPPVSGPPPTV